MELFLHSEGSGEVEIVTVEETALIKTLVEETSGHQIWIAEQVDEVDLELTFVDAHIHQHHHVHRGHCRALRADVRYETEHKVDEIRPTATIGEVLDWAVGEHGFDLPKDQRPKYVLALPGAEEYLPTDVRVITLVGKDSSVRLDLLPKDHFGG
jgi:hypothetical protein